jgi:hypothetical protein
MGRGGKREPGIDPKTGEKKKLGRPKSVRPTNVNVAQRVLNQAKAETLWHSIIELEKNRLGIGDDGKLLPPPKGAIEGPDYQGRFSIIPLTNVLRYLEDRAYGRPVDTVNHLHDKPLDVNMTLSLGEGMRLAMEKADQRVRNRN